MFAEPVISSARRKLERSIATKRTIMPGERIEENELLMLSPGEGLYWKDRCSVIGHKVTCEIPAHEESLHTREASGISSKRVYLWLRRHLFSSR